MKVCGKCGLEKSSGEFSWRNKAKGKLNLWCRSCMQGYDRVRYSDTDRHDKVRINSLALQKRNIEWLEEYLANKFCIDCGNADRRVLQFDHLDRSTKLGNISVMVRSYGLDNLKVEIDKCVIRCANCHMIRTGEQFNWRTAH